MFALALAGLGQVLMAMAGSAAEAGQASLHIAGRLPVVCSLAERPFAGSDGVLVREFCNAPRGYVIQVRHDPALAGRVTFAYADRATSASATGTTEIWRASEPSRSERLLRVVGLDDADAARFLLSILPVP